MRNVFVGSEFSERLLKSAIILGIISPPFQQIQYLPIEYLVLVSIVKEARLAIVPANCTGSKFAAGVIAPVLPT
jgi:hypothetical protein